VTLDEVFHVRITEQLRKEVAKFLSKLKVGVISLVLSVVFEGVFGIFLEYLVCL
jgi:hypothetical protein